MAAEFGALALQGLPGLLTAGATTAASLLVKPKMPQITFAAPQMPTPVDPPNMPLSPDDTASAVRARLLNRAGSTGVGSFKDLRLTTPSSRKADNASVAPQRATLLGGGA